MNFKKVIIIGAGMSGLGAGIKLQKNGFDCVILEAEKELGGLAGSFKIQNKYFPAGYHHILYQDKPLRSALKRAGLWNKISWKKTSSVFVIENKIYNPANPADFLKMPMPLKDKFRFARLMAYCMLRKSWNQNLGDARSWLDKIAGPNVRKIIFDPLMDIKYGLGSERLSASWIGSRLHYQEFSKPLGYIPGNDWTKILIDKLAEEFEKMGGEIITGASAKKINIENNEFKNMAYRENGGEKIISGDILVNTAAPHIFLSLCDYRNKKLEKIEYLDSLSLILETGQKLPKNFYMLACLSPRRSFGGIFALSSLNKTISARNGTVLNFFTNLNPGNEYLRNKAADELLKIYLDDFKSIFGFELKPIWHHLSLIKNYSPKFLNNYQNPDERGNIRGIYFSGNYLTYPAITSIGSALASGEKTANYIIEDYK